MLDAKNREALERQRLAAEATAAQAAARARSRQAAIEARQAARAAGREPPCYEGRAVRSIVGKRMARQAKRARSAADDEAVKRPRL